MHKYQQANDKTPENRIVPHLLSCTLSFDLMVFNVKQTDVFNRTTGYKVGSYSQLM